MSGTELILPNGQVMQVRDRRAIIDMRDPKGATQRLGWTSPEMPIVNEWDADQAFRLGYLANVIAYRCVQLRARACASVPLVAGRKHRDAKTVVDGARAAQLLGPPPGGPAPKLSARKLIRWTIAQQIVTGRRAWEIETDGAGRVVGFWPLAAASLQAVPSQGGTEWFRLFRYGRPDKPTVFRPEDVFYGWDPAGTDFRQSESGLQSARYDLSLVTLCDRYGLSFLRNNAVPATVVTTAAFPNEELRRQFRKQWAGEFGGVDNAGRTSFHEVGDDGDGPVAESIDVKVLGLSAKDSRLLEQRKAAMIEIAIACGTPWAKLDASGRTFDNADAEDTDWWENTILPDLIDLEDDINMQLAPRLGGEVVWFDLRGVRALRPRLIPVTMVPALVEARVISRNEGREVVGEEALDGLDDIEDVPEPPVLPVVSPQLALPAGDPPEPEPERTVPVVETRGPDPEQIEIRRTRIWRTNDAVVRGLEARWERVWRRLFVRQADAVLARLRGKRGRQALGYGTDGQPVEGRAPADPVDPAEIFSPVFWTAEAVAVAIDLYEDVTVAGLSRLTAGYGISFDLAADWVAEFIEARANQLAGQVTQTTYEAIQRELVEGVGVGESIDQLADRIRHVFAVATDSRARTIARTEVISAYNGSAVLGASQLPVDVVAAQEWIATRDGRTREAHADADGQMVAVGTAFTVAGRQLAYPGDPNGGADNTVNCRCTVGFLTPEEWQELAGRGPRQVDVRMARALLRMVNADGFDVLVFRRSLQEVAAA